LKVLYHKNCADGITAAAIVKYYFSFPLEKNEQVVCIPMSHGATVSFDEIEADEEVYIVDFAFSCPDEMDKLLSITQNVTWIDHHKTSIEKYKKYSKLKGSRNIDRCGAYLTWKYLFEDFLVPEVVRYVDDHDRAAGLMVESDVFVQGLLLYSGLTPNNDKFWNKVLTGSPEKMDKIIDAGNILEANSDMWRREAKTYRAEFSGLNFLVMNKPGNSKAFKYVDDGTCEGLMLWTYDGSQYMYSLYQGKLGKKLGTDMSVIAASYGGGGHPGAAGFVSKRPII